MGQNKKVLLLIGVGRSHVRAGKKRTWKLSAMDQKVEIIFSQLLGRCMPERVNTRGNLGGANSLRQPEGIEKEHVTSHIVVVPR